MERLTGWHKLQNFDDEDVYYLQAEISIPLNGDVKRDIEKTLREQIAGEIKELAPKLLARWIEAGDPWVENWNYLDEENAQRIVEFIAAAIARGEK